jgi:hypothetical protein
MVRINKRQDEIAAAYAAFAPRYEGDDALDVQLFVERMRVGQSDGAQ